MQDLDMTYASNDLYELLSMATSHRKHGEIPGHMPNLAHLKVDELCRTWRPAKTILDIILRVCSWFFTSVTACIRKHELIVNQLFLVFWIISVHCKSFFCTSVYFRTLWKTKFQSFFNFKLSFTSFISVKI